MSDKNFWGWSAMLDCSGCDIDAVSSRENIQAFIAYLIADIGMTAVGPTHIEYLCEGDPKEGWTAMQMISTSSVVGHFMNTGECYIDVFSCKPFDVKVVQVVVQKFFLPRLMRVNYITRDAG